MQLFMQRAGFYCKQIVLIFRQLYLLVYKDATLKDRRAKGEEVRLKQQSLWRSCAALKGHKDKPKSCFLNKKKEKKLNEKSRVTWSDVVVAKCY